MGGQERWFVCLRGRGAEKGHCRQPTGWGKEAITQLSARPREGDLLKSQVSLPGTGGASGKRLSASR